MAGLKPSSETKFAAASSNAERFPVWIRSLRAMATAGEPETREVIALRLERIRGCISQTFISIQIVRESLIAARIAHGLVSPVKNGEYTEASAHLLSAVLTRDFLGCICTAIEPATDFRDRPESLNRAVVAFPHFDADRLRAEVEAERHLYQEYLRCTATIAPGVAAVSNTESNAVATPASDAKPRLPSRQQQAYDSYQAAEHACEEELKDQRHTIGSRKTNRVTISRRHLIRGSGICERGGSTTGRKSICRHLLHSKCEA